MKKTPALLYHGLPLFILLFPFAWVALAGNDRALKGEAGMVELATFLFLVIAIGFCVSSLAVTRHLGLSGFLKTWLLILIAGATYFGLEEISYGQHMFGWGTADSWKELNDQDETNLHNVHALFDQVPRALLTLGILVGGVILPIYLQFIANLSPLSKHSACRKQSILLAVANVGLRHYRLDGDINPPVPGGSRYRCHLYR
jgi:hypothetical protein